MAFTTMETAGPETYLRGKASVETADALLEADEIDYNSETGKAAARGNVRLRQFSTGERLTATRAEYDVKEKTGTFWDVTGTSPAKIDARPGLLTTAEPFYFEGEWAKREVNRYILFNGYVTDCKTPNPWWILKGPRFDIVPHQSARAYKTVFWLRLPGIERFGVPDTLHIPLLYAPVFYKSLAKNPRQSGFLTPNIGNSSRHGQMAGIGYYWAINRSYDITYRLQYFSVSGFAHHANFRGKINDRTDFGGEVYGVNDRGTKVGDQLIKQGGYLVVAGVRSDLGRGWTARGDLNYLSSFDFRRGFTESFHEAIFAESRSTGFITKHWSNYGFNIVADRDEVFQFAAPGETTPDSSAKVVTYKLPEFQFIGRERQINDKILPLWFSVDSSAGFYRRQEPLFSTGQFMDRLSMEPRISTQFSFKGFTLVPSFSAKVTRYSDTFIDNRKSGRDLVETSRQIIADLAFPPLSRIFMPQFLKGAKLKHTIEPRVTFRDITGVTDFNKIIRIDSTDLMANTREIEFSLTNRLYMKGTDGNVREVLTWQLWQRRYFDPTFGGAILPGHRNVVLSSTDLTGYAFMDQLRRYSPIVSALRYGYQFGVEWRTDYDPFRGHFVNNSLTADYRKDKYYVSAGHSMVRDDIVLSPNQNQFRGAFGIGNDNRRGWNTGFNFYYDYRLRLLEYVTTQLTYNTDCCGYSIQFQRFDVPGRQDTRFRFSFAVANLGAFGTLKRQEKLF